VVAVFKPSLFVIFGAIGIIGWVTWPA